MSRFLLSLVLLGLTFGACAQSSLFVPRNLLRAYDKNTRSRDGQPGASYWQNRAAYVINASLDPKKRRLSGEETVTYTNNSPDSLKFIRFKLAHDRYRKGSLRSSDVEPSDVDDGVRIEALTFNGQAVPEKQRRRYNTFLDVQLGAARLAPKTSATITVKWSYTLPAGKGAERECVCDASTFFVPYWYPQIAVYDDLRGWADAPYTGLQEFYHDFADYDVRFSLPKGYMMWATGEWQNPGEVLEPAYFERFQKAHTSNEVVSVFTEAELKSGGVFKKAKKNVFRYKATEVPDFAFGASDHYNWDATSVVVDDRTGRRTFVSAAYDTQSKDYYNVARIAADGIRLMSTWLPGYPFPYPCETVFNGNDAMEFPMMVNDASTRENAVTSLTLHEVSHTYFPFMMGINEQEYAWMDEGWAAFFDYVLTDSLTRGKQGNVRDYSAISGNDGDVPPMVRSRFLSGGAYRVASYQRPQAAYLCLLDQLGYETFHKCMRTYMDRWKGKHPMPFDFFYTWNESAGQNLDWFWKPWFFEWGSADLGIQGVMKDEAAGCQLIYVERKGALPVPVHLAVEYSDGSSETFHRKPDVWRDGKTLLRVPCPAGKSPKNITLGKPAIPDVERKDNVWKN